MTTQQLLAPLFAMVALTAIVWMRMYVVRIGEMRARRIDPQSVATARQAAGALEQTAPADNFRNLFEVPVLFYAWVAVLLALNEVRPWMVYGAWAFVLLRALHSLIHCTYNRVIHRFVVYVLGAVLMFGLWVALAFATLA